MVSGECLEKGTVSNMLKGKCDIEQQYESNGQRDVEKGKTNHDELNNLWDFFQTFRRENIPISGPMLQEQARDFSVKMGEDDFKVSSFSNGIFQKNIFLIL